jgi:hypothetical protein
VVQVKYNMWHKKLAYTIILIQTTWKVWWTLPLFGDMEILSVCIFNFQQTIELGLASCNKICGDIPREVWGHGVVTLPIWIFHITCSLVFRLHQMFSLLQLHWTLLTLVLIDLGDRSPCQTYQDATWTIEAIDSLIFFQTSLYILETLGISACPTIV